MNKIVSMAVVFILLINATIPLTSLAISEVIQTDYILHNSDDNKEILDIVADNANEVQVDIKENSANILGISKISISPQEGRKFIQAGDGYEYGFKNNVFEYNYYMLSTDIKDLTLELGVDIAPYTLDVETTDVNGDKIIHNVIDGASKTGNLKFDAKVIRKLDVTVNLLPTTQSYTYTINILPIMKGQLDPKIHLSVKKIIGNEYAELTATLENAYTNSFGFMVHNTTDEFKFTDINGKPFTDMREKLEKNRDNYYELKADAVNLDYMRSDGRTLKVSAATPSGGGIIQSNASGTPVYKFKISAKAEATAEEIIENLTLVDGDLNNSLNIETTIQFNPLFDYRYTDVRQRITVATDEIIKRHGSKTDTLVYIDAGTTRKVEAYVRHLTSDKLVYFTLTDQADATNTTPIMTLEDGKLSYPLTEGIYNLNINSPGYIAYNKQGIYAYADKDTFLRNIILIAGDIDNNNHVDAIDRTELLRVYNHGAKDGIVDIAGNTVAADFNNDGYVNALDLGELLRNMGKSYK